MHLLHDDDASLEPLQGKTVAVLGYGNQGRAQALNLRDSGISVIVGNRDDEYGERAAADGFAPLSIREAAEAGDILLILTTDESQPLIWPEQIAPGVRAGKTLVWSSGYNVGYGLIQPPADVDVVMVAPRMIGPVVRTLYERGSGALAQFAVHQDVSGHARATALALCKGIGLTRGGAFESSFREEAELDLFAEQVVWAGPHRVVRLLLRVGRGGRLLAGADGDGAVCVGRGGGDHGRHGPQRLLPPDGATTRRPASTARSRAGRRSSTRPCVPRPGTTCTTTSRAVRSSRSGATSRSAARSGWLS